MSFVLAGLFIAASFFTFNVYADQNNNPTGNGTQKSIEYLKKTIENYNNQKENISMEIALLEAGRDGNVDALNQLSDYLGDDVISEITSTPNKDEQQQKWNNIIDRLRNEYNELDKQIQDATATLEILKTLNSPQTGSTSTQSNMLTLIIVAVLSFALGAATMYIIKRKKMNEFTALYRYRGNDRRGNRLFYLHTAIF